jgi:hypothetical protein
MAELLQRYYNLILESARINVKNMSFSDVDNSIPMLALNSGLMSTTIIAGNLVLIGPGFIANHGSSQEHIQKISKPFSKYKAS